jgi:hypothetical protein
VDLVVLVATGAAVYFVVTGVYRWWNGYRERHNVVLQVVTLTAVVLVVVWASQSSTGARVADIAFTAFLVLVAVAIVASLVAGQRRIKSRQAMMSRAADIQRPPRSRSRSWKSDDDVYAIGAFDARTDELRAIKIGWTARGEGVREAEVEDEQLGRMNTSRPLGRGPGGERREQRMLADLDRWRYPRSEWFEPSPEVVAAVGELERLTEDGRALVRSTATRSRVARAQSSTVAS